VAVDPALAEEFSWLKVDPTPILGDSRPRKLKDLLDKSHLWQQLYRDWLGAHHPSYLDGLKSVSGIEKRLAEYTARFDQTYSQFYKAAGDLKDAVRKNEAAARQRFPWAPPDAKALLGDARPKDFETLVAFGHDGTWLPAYQGWLRAKPPFPDADAWLDWVLMKGGGEQWEQALEPTVEVFAKEIGRLKDALRKREGTAGTARRMVRQAGEHVGEVKATVDAKVEKLASTEIGLDLAGEFNAGVRQGARKATQPQANQPQATLPKTEPPKQTTPPNSRRAMMAAKKAAPVVAPRSQVPQHIQRQVQLASPLLQLAPSYAGWADWVATRFADFGGSLGDRSGAVSGYKALIEGDCGYLAQQLQPLAEHLHGSDDATLFALLSTFRAAVYRLAWNVDLGFQTYFGGWPHESLWAVVQTIDASGSAKLRYAGGRAVYGLAGDVQRLYEGATGLLDVAKQVVDAQVPGYHIDDGAVPWSTHQVVLAKDEMAGLGDLAAGWASEEPAEDEDDPAAEDAAQNAFGMPYDSLLQLV
jgi:hypothetical protein